MNLAKALLWTYLRLVRPWWSAIWCWYFTRRLKPRTGLWEEYKYLSAREFSAKLMQMPYTGDPAKGFLDYTIDDPDLFWTPGLPHRDCDDFAYLWYLWGIANAQEAWLVVIMDGLHIGSSHYFTVVRMGSTIYHICNYSWDAAEKNSLRECIDEFRDNLLTRWGKYRNPVVIIDRHFKEEE